MSHLYVACELGVEKGRIFLGSLQNDKLTVSGAGEFPDPVVSIDGTPQWDVSRVYQQVLAGLHGIVVQEEPVRGLSFYSGVTDFLLFETDGSVLTPATRLRESDAAAEFKKILSQVPASELYAETGVQPMPGGALCQLARESSRRIKRAAHALSLPESFNFLFSGVARGENSQASLSQLYSPLARNWSERLLNVAGVPRKILPELVPASTVLAPVRDDIAHQHGLEDAKVVATCGFDLAAALAPIAISDQDNWAFLCPDQSSIMGTIFQEAYIDDISREMNYSNLLGYADSAAFYKTWTGLKLIEDCRRTWSNQDRALDTEVLMHLATSAPAFEALIDPGDPRFASAEDLPQAIQAFCRETGQEAPRKPGPVLRCLLESLALHYRKGLVELEYLTNGTFSRLYVLGGKSNLLLNHFLANALQIPVVVVPR